MEIITNSGAVEVNKRSNYGKWLIGYTESGAWSGYATVVATWLLASAAAALTNQKNQ